MGCINSSEKEPANQATQNFVKSLYEKDWQTAEDLLLLSDAKDSVDVNGVVNKTSVLAAFLANTDGNQKNLLERILFPAVFSLDITLKPCDIFNLRLADGVNSASNKSSVRTAFDILFDTKSCPSLPSDRSLSSYTELLLEAADILHPSPDRRADPSLWTKKNTRTKKWNHDKELFISSEVLIPCLKSRPQDTPIFQQVLDTDLIHSEERMANFVRGLASSSVDTTPTLRHIIATGKFPESLTNSNIAVAFEEFPSSQLSPPILAAVANGNAEFVKELVANKVGGDILSGISSCSSSNSYLSLHDLNSVQQMKDFGYNFEKVNLLHVAAGSIANGKTNSDEGYCQILSTLLGMVGSNELINAPAKFVVKSNKFSTSREFEVTPAMLAGMLKHTSRMNILLLANRGGGGDQLPESIRGKFASFNVWLEDFNKSNDREYFDAVKDYMMA